MLLSRLSCLSLNHLILGVAEHRTTKFSRSYVPLTYTSKCLQVHNNFLHLVPFSLMFNKYYIVDYFIKTVAYTLILCCLLIFV